MYWIKPGQHHAGEEGFAGAGGAKNAGGTLHKFLQIHADRVTLFAGVADDEMLPYLLRVAEDLGHITGCGQADGSMMGRDGFDRQRVCPGRDWLPSIGRNRACRVLGRDPASALAGLPGWYRASARAAAGNRRRQAQFALLIGKARIGRAQLQIGDQAVELPVAAVDDHKTAFLDFLRGDGQPDVQAVFQRTADDIANFRILPGSVWRSDLCHAISLSYA